MLIDFFFLGSSFGSKLIELSAIELKKLQNKLHKSNQQNWHLARINSDMLAVGSLSSDLIVQCLRISYLLLPDAIFDAQELNMRKDRVCYFDLFMISLFWYLFFRL